MPKLQEIFDSVNKNDVFRDKSLLQTNYKPENIPHRDQQINQGYRDNRGICRLAESQYYNGQKQICKVADDQAPRPAANKIQ